MAKIPRTDPRAQRMSRDLTVGRDGLDELMAGRHHWVLATARVDGRPQMSLVTGGLMASGLFAVSTYPERAKARNARRNPDVSILVMGERFNDEWVQVDGRARVLDLPEAADQFVEYYRCISGEHPDWDEYREAMAQQGKCLIVVEATRWSPVSKGGFPPSLFED